MTFRIIAGGGLAGGGDLRSQDKELRLADMAQATLKGRAAGAGTGPPQDLTAAQLKAILESNAQPAFSVHRNAVNQSIASVTITLVQFTHEEFDTNNNFDNATNYRFTPTVAGKYIITFSAWLLGLLNGETFVTSIFKNGSLFVDGLQNVPGANADVSSIASALIDFNGTTDFVDFRVFHNNAGALNLSGGIARTRATGMRIGP